MDIIYENVDITNYVKVSSADIVENSGGESDYINISFSDTEGNWSKWMPKKGDSIEIQFDTFKSGKMFIGFLNSVSGTFTIKARSLPFKKSSIFSRSWENIRLKSLITDVANELGLEAVFYNIENYFFQRIDQINETGLNFVKRICIREGYISKVYDGKLIIYNERVMESEKPVIILSPLDMKYDLSSDSFDLYSSCSVRYLDEFGQELSYLYSPSNAPYGSKLKINELIFSRAESIRFSKNYLYNANKFENKGCIEIPLNSKIASGNTIQIIDTGMFDGIYFVHKTIQKLNKNKSVLYVRGIPEVYQ